MQESWFSPQLLLPNSPYAVAWPLAGFYAVRYFLARIVCEFLQEQGKTDMNVADTLNQAIQQLVDSVTALGPVIEEDGGAASTGKNAADAQNAATAAQAAATAAQTSATSAVAAA